MKQTNGAHWLGPGLESERPIVRACGEASSSWVRSETRLVRCKGTESKSSKENVPI